MNDRVLLTHPSAATMATHALGYGLIEDAGIAIEGRQISWIGPKRDCSKNLKELPTQNSWADLAIWDVNAAAELSNGIDINTLQTRVSGGVFDEA